MGRGLMDPYYFRQIKIPLSAKAKLARWIMRFITRRNGPVERGRGFDGEFLDQSMNIPALASWRERDPWLLEHVTRVYWVCCEMGFLRYQYPYPSTGQLYLPTRLGRVFAALPEWAATVFVIVAYIIAVLGWPIKHFHRLRDVVTLVAGSFAWLHQHTINSVVVLVAICSGICATWLAGILAGDGQ